MALRKWEPVRDFTRLQEKLNRVFEENLRFVRARIPGAKPVTGIWSPPVDIYETDESIVVKAEVPGMRIEDIQIKVKDSTLGIRGERKFVKAEKDENCHLVERLYGSFSRNFSLPVAVDQSKAKATYQHGVLEVVLPKRGETKPRSIKVETERA